MASAADASTMSGSRSTGKMARKRASRAALLATCCAIIPAATNVAARSATSSERARSADDSLKARLLHPRRPGQCARAGVPNREIRDACVTEYRSARLGQPTRSQLGAILEVRQLGRRLAERLQHLADRAIELRIATLRVILRTDLHFDVRFGSVVFDSPAHVLEPERELRLGGDRSVDQRM